MHREKYDLGAAPGISQVARDVDPAHLPHRNIEDHDVGSELEVLSDDNSAVGYGADDFVALLFFEHLAKMVENRRIIVAEEYGGALHGPFFMSRGVQITQSNLRNDGIRTW